MVLSERESIDEKMAFDFLEKTVKLLKELPDFGQGNNMVISKCQDSKLHFAPAPIMNFINGGLRDLTLLGIEKQFLSMI